MIIDIILLNLYYIGVAVALIVRDMLWLRTIMIFAASCLISYGFKVNNHVVVAWNILFVSINIFQVIRLIIEKKPVHVDEEIVDLYEGLFSEMSAKEFIFFWNHGELIETRDDMLCTYGKNQDNLCLMVSGIASVQKFGHEIANLVRGNFIGEMGFITNGPASADVIAEGRVQFISWTRQTVEWIKKTNPDIYNKLQKIISVDLVKKLQVYQ